MSLPLFAYFQMYLIDLTELLYSTFMCASYVFDSKGEYGKATGYPLRCHRFAFIWFLIYCHFLLIFCIKDIQSFSVSVLDANARGYSLEHFPSMMHGEFGCSMPQCPCVVFRHNTQILIDVGIMCFNACYIVDFAYIILLYSQVSICAYDNPFFCYSK